MLHIHRSERADLLVAQLGDQLAEPGPDPMRPEMVAVPTRGVERWLTQRLSHRLGTGSTDGDGVCANIEFPFPGTVVGRVTALGAEFGPDQDPWPPERSVWPLLEVVDAGLDDEFLAPLAAHLEASSPVDLDGRAGLSRFATVRHLADLFDRYGVHRPGMVRAWAAGRLSGGPPRPAEEWQAELWRRLRARIGAPSPAERFELAVARVTGDPGLVELPDRLSVFGLTRLPASQVEILRAVAAHRQVHLYLLHPSGALWERVERAGPPRGPGRRDDPASELVAHPLLRSWGRDAREMQLVLGSGAGAESTYRPVPESPGTLLGRIQADIRADHRPPGIGPFGPGGDPRPVLAEDDDSLRVHSCHGRLRQVEVMRDAILHLLDEDPGLELRDVIVMCPDIETYAPLIHGVFGAGGAEADPSDLPRIRARLADRAIRQTNPLLAVATRLLDLAGSRVTASEVLDLLSMEPVARRLRLDENDLARVQAWVSASGIRWGIDALQRDRRGLTDLDANTWTFGLDRLLSGVAMGEDDLRLFGDTLPLDDVSGGDLELAGRLAEAVDRLDAALHRLAGPQPIRTWAAALAEATEKLARAAGSEEWQHDQLHRVLDDAVVESDPAATGRDGPVLGLSEVRALFAGRLAGRPTRANFRTGDLTICTLVPMRSVPHRVVGLLGLDDEVFPRHPGEDGDDLLLADPQLGDRDARSEDRQLLLDALLAATEHVVITYNGKDLRTNQPRPPAVPVSELLDVIDRTVRPAEPGRRAAQSVVIDHPLQSFDTKNFTPGLLAGPGPWSFDPVGLSGARAQAAERVPAGPFLTGPLAPVHHSVLELSALVRFFEHPVRAFLRDRLGLSPREEEDESLDSIPLDLSALEKWGVGDRLLDALVRSFGTEPGLRAERARGLLPPSAVGDAILDEVHPGVERIYETFRAEPDSDQPPRSSEVNLLLPDGRSLIGTVSGLRGSTVFSCVYSNLGPKHRLAAWVRFLALSAARPDLGVSAVAIGRGRRAAGKQMVARARFSALPGGSGRADALRLLMDLVDLYDRGMREPLPLYCQTSEAWAAAARRGEDPRVAAGKEWTTDFGGFDREDRDVAHVTVLGGVQALDDVVAELPAPDDPPADPGTGRFGLFAHRLWDAVLDHERLDRTL